MLWDFWEPMSTKRVYKTVWVVIRVWGVSTANNAVFHYTTFNYFNLKTIKYYINMYRIVFVYCDCSSGPSPARVWVLWQSSSPGQGGCTVCWRHPHQRRSPHPNHGLRHDEPYRYCILHKMKCSIHFKFKNYFITIKSILGLPIQFCLISKNRFCVILYRHFTIIE